MRRPNRQIARVSLAIGTSNGLIRLSQFDSSSATVAYRKCTVIPSMAAEMQVHESEALICGYPNDVVGNFTPIARFLARRVLIEFLERGVTIAAREISSVVDEDDVPADGMAENAVQFVEDRRILRPFASNTAGIMTVEPKQRRAIESLKDNGQLDCAIAEEQMDVLIAGESDTRPLMKPGVDFNGIYLLEDVHQGIWRVTEIRTGLHKRFQMVPLGILP